MARAGAVRGVVAVAVAGLLLGCTSDPAPNSEATPTPTAGEPVEVVPRSGDRIAVIVPPPPVVARAEGAALLRAATELAATPPAGVADVRVVAAVSEAFVRDLANLAVDDGYDVVCVVGTGSAPLALELARARREARFCTTDSRIAGGPVNLVAVALDPDALVQAGAIAIGTAPAPVGVLLSPQLGDVEELTATFTEAAADPVQPSPPPTAPTDPPAPGASPPPATSPTPAPSPPGPTSPQPPFVTATPGLSPASQVAAAQQLADQRPSRALLLVTPAGFRAASVVAAQGVDVVGVVDWLVDVEGEQPADVLVQLTVDWAALLTGAIEAGRADEAVQVTLRGVSLLDALPGPAPGGGPAAERTTAFLEQGPG